MKKTLISLPALALGITMLANAQAATTPTKVGIIHIQNAILATKDGQKAANDLQTKFSPTKSQTRQDAERRSASGRQAQEGQRRR